MNPAVDFFFNKATRWQAEYNKLRSLALFCGLTEELKWGVPCYTFRKSNIVLLHGFKDYCALLFPKGVLLQDANELLIQQTENVQAARQIRFTGLEEIAALEATIKAYIYEAIEVERLGLKVKLKNTEAFETPAEFQLKLAEDPNLEAAFKALTSGRQRAYLLHFVQPKQSKTRASRVAKCIPKILDGKGMHDR